MDYIENRGENRIAGNVVYFDINNHLKCEKKIITHNNGIITSVDDYRKGIVGVSYLSDSLIIYPGLIDLHSHSEANMYQLFTETVKEDEMWDNRFEWRYSAVYNTCYKIPNSTITKEWDNSLGEEDDSLSLGEMIYLYSELQAAAGGTILLQEDGNNIYNNYLDCHKAIKLIRSTADSDDLLTDTDNAIASYIQLYLPDRIMGPDDHSSYAPPKLTDWPIKSQIEPDSNKTCLENIIDRIKEGNAARAYLIHMAEGRTGNLKSDIGMDEFCKIEFSEFKSEIEAYVEDGTVTKEQIIDANITLIHGCGIDLGDEDTYKFIKDYGIGIVWSPVSNLLLYGDTPDFYKYIDDDSIDIAIGSDWSPSGSKTVWDECKFALKFICKREDINLSSIEEELFKAATIKACQAVGLNKLGNIKEHNCADFMIIDTGISEDINADTALDIFFRTGEEDVVAVYVGGKVIYADRKYIDAYLSDNEYEYEWCSTDTDADSSTDNKYYNLNGICKSGTFYSNYKIFADIITDVYGSISSLKDYEDSEYRNIISNLAYKYCK